MPKYTAAQKKAYAKRMAKKNGGYKKKYANAKRNKKMLNSRPFVETKFIHQDHEAHEPLQLNTADEAPTAARPIPNATVLTPHAWTQGWTQGLTRSDITGRAIYPRYLKMKMVIDISSLPVQAYNLRCIHGFCTNTLQGLEEGDLSESAFVGKIYEQLKKSGLLGNYLDFNIKRKGIKVIKDFRVRGSRNTSLSAGPTAAAPATQMAPNNDNLSFTFQWPMGTKTWVTRSDESQPEKFYPTRSWIPFVCFYCPEFVSVDQSTEAPHYLLSSKLWYTDQ